MAWARLAPAMAAALRGERDELLRIMTPELRAAVRWDEIFAWWTAACFALVNERDEAIDGLAAGDAAGWPARKKSANRSSTNAAPAAADDSAVTDEDHAVRVNVLGNDSDPAGALDPLRIASVTSGSKGAATIDTRGTADPADDA